MPEYGEIRVDYITYTTGTSPNEGQGTVTVSGLINNPTFSGNVIIANDLTVSGKGIFASGSLQLALMELAGYLLTTAATLVSIRVIRGTHLRLDQRLPRSVELHSLTVVQLTV
jgi:hypothetical protein